MARKVKDPRELFLHQLGDILTAERTIEKMLPKLKRQAKDDKLSRGIDKHINETRKHIKNVEQVFRELGEKPKAERCPGIEGLRAEHEELAGQVAPELGDVLASGSAARTEHYEIAVYSALVQQARAIGQRNAAKLLSENLKQDKEMLREIESISRDLSKKTKEKAKA